MASRGGETRIRLSDERRKAIRDSLIRFYSEEMDERLSEFRANQLLDFMVSTLGASVYNQAVQDARAFMQEKLGDLDAVLFEREQ